ncbi:MAG: efflux RND transporter periplasmic adaptor subunit [Gemmataceae bacterium]
MKIRIFMFPVILFGLLAVGSLGAFVTKDSWYSVVFPDTTKTDDDHEDDHEHSEEVPDHLDLTPQAQASIGLHLNPLPEPGTFTTHVRFPAIIVPKPGETHIGVTTYMKGVVTKIHVRPGEMVQGGHTIIDLHLHSHDLQKEQVELYKAFQNIQINEEQQAILKPVTSMGASPKQKMLELQFEKRRLEAEVHAIKASLKIHGFRQHHLEQIASGQFLKQWTINAPQKSAEDRYSSHAHHSRDEVVQVYDVEKLLVKPGDEVQPGQLVCTLANHQTLYLEARIPRDRVPLAEQAIQKLHLTPAHLISQGALAQGLTPAAGPVASAVQAAIASRTPDVHRHVRAELPSSRQKESAPTLDELSIQYLEHDVDRKSQTAGLFVQVKNTATTYKSNDRLYRLWKYRPNQRLYLLLPTETLSDVFVLPRSAVVMDGAEAYVFRQNGKEFQLQAVRIVHSNENTVVIANDGSVFPDQVLVHNGAAQLYRALKTKSDGGGHHHHHH